jgi:diguanylate cyclase (GGDEF)-like protein
MNEVLTFRRSLPAAALSVDMAIAEREAARLQVLESYEILDSAPEKSYDDIARLAAFICAAPVAMVSFFDSERQWVKARFNSGAFAEAARDLPRSQAFCDVAIAHGPGIILVPDLMADARFADHALAFGAARLRFYAAMPLVSPAGIVLGTLSVLDRRCRSLTADQTSALETLGRQILELLEMRRTVIGLSQANARLGQQSLTDALTGVPNRRAYDQKLTEEVARAKRTRAALSLLLIDVDLFKPFNDTFGHPAGDAALQSMARVLQASLRPYDFLARYGGEEFAIILPATDLAEAVTVAERVRVLVAHSEFPHRKFTISIGVARLDPDREAKTLVQAADDGLYRAKANGRNRVGVGEVKDSKDYFL